MSQSYRDLIARFETILSDAAAHRAERDDLDDSGRPAWIAYELQIMHEAVNAHRAENGLAPVDIAAVETVESRAAGHSDYLTQFALGCADLVLDTTGRR